MLGSAQEQEEGMGAMACSRQVGGSQREGGNSHLLRTEGTFEPFNLIKCQTANAPPKGAAQALAGVLHQRGRNGAVWGRAAVVPPLPGESSRGWRLGGTAPGLASACVLLPGHPVG